MTASAARTPPGAAACPAWPSGSPWWTAAWTSPARRADRPGSPSSCRCAPGTADAHRDRRGRRGVPGRPGPAAAGRGPPGLRRGGRRRPALDREVVSQLLAASRHAGDLDPLTPRERDVLALMAEGRSNAGVATALVLSLGTVEKHVASIFGKLGLPASDTDNRRVLAVLRYLGS